METKINMIDEFDSACNNLNNSLDLIGNILTTYTRNIGSMYMASADTENRIEEILNSMDKSVDILEKVKEEDLACFDTDIESIEDLQSWLNDIKVFSSYQRKEISKAREFLSRYGC